VRTVPVLGSAFGAAGWDDLVAEALTRRGALAGGSLVISPTPAMTLIDVDGPPPLAALALAAVPAIAGAMRRFDMRWIGRHRLPLAGGKGPTPRRG
jgi:hypothetical protein